MQNDSKEQRLKPQKDLPLIPPTLPYEMQKNLKEQIEILSKRAFRIEDLPEIITNIYSEDLILSHWGVTGLRKMLSVENGGPIQQVIDANLVPKLIEIIDKAVTPKHVLEALWALTNLLSGNTEEIKIIIDIGGIYLFVKLLSSPYKDIAEQAVWAIGNIAGEGTHYRNLMLQVGVIDPIIQIINTSTNKDTKQQCTWSLSNLCRGKPIPEFRYVKNALPVFCKIIMNETDIEVLTDACWALTYLNDGENSRLQQVIDSGVVPTLIKLLDHSQLIIPTIRVLGKIVTVNEFQISDVLQQNLFAKISELLSHEKKSFRGETCQTLQYITANNSGQVTQVIQNLAILEKLFQLIQTDVEEIKRQVISIISNATQHGQQIDLEVLLKYGIIRTYVQLLRSVDVETIIDTLMALFNLFKRGEEFFQDINPFFLEFEQLGGVDILKELYKHDNQDLQFESKSILDQFNKGEQKQ